jgi:circadian clock protein KaiC
VYYQQKNRQRTIGDRTDPRLNSLKEASSMKRVPTGIDGLDPLIEQGLPKQSLILVAGAPGTGKTSLCCKFLERGAAAFDEKGLYVSLFESKETMVENLSHQFGPELPELVRRGMIEILSFPTMKGKGISGLSMKRMYWRG